MSEPLNRRSRSLSIDVPQIDQRISIWDDVTPLSPQMLEHAGIKLKEQESKMKLTRPPEQIQKKLDLAVENYENSSRIITEAADNENAIVKLKARLEDKLKELADKEPRRASELKIWMVRLDEAEYRSKRVQIDDFYDNKVLVRSVFWKILNRTGYSASDNLAIRLKEEESREITYREKKSREYEAEGSL